MCKHENAIITVKQVLYSDIYVSHLEVYDGDPEEVSYSVSCPDCGIDTCYSAKRLPKWIVEIIKALGRTPVTTYP